MSRFGPLSPLREGVQPSLPFPTGLDQGLMVPSGRSPSPPGPRPMLTLRQEDEQLLKRLRTDARRIASSFGMEWRSLGRTRRDARLYGVCDTEGNIRIRLRSLHTGKLLRYSSLVATLCHELAHLRHFDHGPQFTDLYQRMLDFSRQQGIYAPLARGVARARREAGRQVRPDLAAAAPPRRRKRSDSRQLPLFPSGE